MTTEHTDTPAANVAELNSTIAQLTKESQSLHSQLGAMQEKNAQLEVQNRALVKENTDYQKANSDYEALKTENAQLKETSETYQTRLTESVRADLIAKGVSDEFLSERSLADLEFLSEAMAGVSSSANGSNPDNGPDNQSGDPATPGEAGIAGNINGTGSTPLSVMDQHKAEAAALFGNN